jgi:protein TonB
MRPRGTAARIPEVSLPAQAARLPAARLTRERLRLAGFAALSLAMHGALFAVFWREPEPLASIGLEVISVELVVGATAPAGIAQAPGEQEVQAAAVTNTQPVEPEQTAEQQATEQPQTVQAALEERAPAPQAAQAEPKPSVAMVETPQPDMATAAARESPPEAAEFSLLPQPAEQPAEPESEAKPVQEAPPKPVKNATPAPERRRIDAPTRDNAVRQAKASAPSTAANNVGVGRSDTDTNYIGRVSAHLRRHQQYPSDARNRGDQGTATVSFSLDGGGRVTSARLVSGSGISSIDSEVQAMVRRASPFPAPPSGRSASFTVPVSFRLN